MAATLDQQKLKADLREAVAAEACTSSSSRCSRRMASRIECAEALARWVHPEKGSVPPDALSASPRKWASFPTITRFMLRKACSRMHDVAGAYRRLSQPLRPRSAQLRNPVSIVTEALAHSGLAASRLHLEVTESCLMEEAAMVRTILEELRARGITIAIDDFGTGYSSLSYLDTLPLDIIKIDRSFVRNIREDTRRFKLLRGTVNLARELGLKIVIEGVETKEQLALINKHRSADLVQGYVFSPPVPSEDIVILSQKSR